MRMPHLLLCCLLLPAALAAQQPGEPAPKEVLKEAPTGEVSLQLRRAWARGDVFAITADVAVHAVGGSGQDVEFWNPKSKESELSVSGVVRVLGVNDAGEPTVALIHVDKARVKEEGAQKTLNLEGADVGLSFPSGQPRLVRKDGQPVPPGEAAQLLKVFLPPTGVNEAAYLSPTGPVRVGDSWPIRKDVFEKVLAASPALAQAGPIAGLEGTVTLEAPETWSGVPGFRLLIRYRFQNGDHDRFVGTTATEVEQHAWVPQDPALKLTRRTGEATIRVNGRVRNEANQLLEVKGQTEIKKTVEILPAKAETSG